MLFDQYCDVQLMQCNGLGYCNNQSFPPMLPIPCHSCFHRRRSFRNIVCRRRQRHTGNTIGFLTEHVRVYLQSLYLLLLDIKFRTVTEYPYGFNCFYCRRQTYCSICYKVLLFTDFHFKIKISKSKSENDSIIEHLLILFRCKLSSDTRI